MNTNSIKALILALILSAPVLVYGQTSSRGARDAATYRAEYRNPVPGEFPLMTWGVTDLAESRPDWFKDLADCGINLGILLYYDIDKVQDILKRVEGTGFKIMTVCVKPDEVRQIMDSPALGGYFLADEPKASAFRSLRNTRNNLYSVDTTHLAMVNLYPWTPESINRASSYEDYIGRSIKELGLPVISYDNYPVIISGGKRIVKADFYKNLELVSSDARKAGIPFWAYGRIIGGVSPYPVPNAADLTFEVFSALAYGAQGISYYTYAAYERPGDTAPVDGNGQKTQLWYTLRKVNTQIRNLKDVFLGCEVIQTGHTGAKIPEGTKRLTSLPAPFTDLRSGEAGILFSHLRNNGRDYYIFVNHDILSSQRVRFSTSGNLVRINDSGKQSKLRVSSVLLPPGGFAIFTH